MKNIMTICLLMLVLVHVSCIEKKADIKNPKTYSNSGLYFKYPGNWKITEDSRSAALRYVFIETSGNAIVIMQIYPSDAAPEFNTFVTEFSDSMKRKLNLKSKESVFDTNKIIADHKTINERFTMTLLNVEDPHIRIYENVKTADKTCFLVAQVSVEDLGNVVSGFDLVFSSFKIAE
jgi:hypothetical protein